VGIESKFYDRAVSNYALPTPKARAPMFGADILGRSWIRPATIGARNHRQGYVRGRSRAALYRPFRFRLLGVRSNYTCDARASKLMAAWLLEQDVIKVVIPKLNQENTMSQKLSDKVALVTGGTSGIGLATAKRFVAEGAYVFITGRRQTELDAAVKEIGKSVTGVQGDVSKLADLDRLYATIEQEQGRLDVIFANAGVGEFAPLGSITEEHFDKIFNTNVKGLLFTVQKALPLMPEGASVILNASTTSIKGTPAFSVYSATKAAVRSFARNWILDLKDRQIRVNALSPGVTPTPGYNLLGLSEEQLKAFVESMASTIPLGRVGKPDEIAKAVVFLASDDSSFVNGIELFVDGGVAQI
jgi:NAD(P)-dependent dehydrogenase (short-subunit alcohol dehydrogenase family)